MHDYLSLTMEKLLCFMDEYDIAKSAVLSLVNPEEEDCSYSTREALADCARQPDPLIPFANVDPRRGSNDGNYDFYPVLKHYADEGYPGFGEILTSLPTNDPRMKGIYRACGELGFPLVFDFRLRTVGVIDPVGMAYL
jgi:predicted TIM-barrel fold metal-dependent hydrolase